jgi:hypothetical protein
MKTKLFVVVVILLATIFLTAIALRDAAAQGSDGLSNKSLMGAFGCRASGFILPPGFNPPAFPEAEVERLVFDGAGNFSGSQTLQLLGIICDYAVTAGTYSINSEGGGSMTYTEVPTPGENPVCSAFASAPRVGNLVIGPSANSFFTVDSLSFSGGCTSQLRDGD